MLVKEHYRGQRMAANEAYRVNAIHIAGFLPTASGTVTITDDEGVIVLQDYPLTAGQFSRIPLLFATPSGVIVQLGGGAAGTLLL